MGERGGHSVSVCLCECVSVSVCGQTSDQSQGLDRSGGTHQSYYGTTCPTCWLSSLERIWQIFTHWRRVQKEKDKKRKEKKRKKVKERK